MHDFAHAFNIILKPLVRMTLFINMNSFHNYVHNSNTNFYAQKIVLPPSLSPILFPLVPHSPLDDDIRHAISHNRGGGRISLPHPLRKLHVRLLGRVALGRSRFTCVRVCSFVCKRSQGPYTIIRGCVRSDLQCENILFEDQSKRTHTHTRIYAHHTHALTQGLGDDEVGEVHPVAQQIADHLLGVIQGALHTLLDQDLVQTGSDHVLHQGAVVAPHRLDTCVMCCVVNVGWNVGRRVRVFAFVGMHMKA